MRTFRKEDIDNAIVLTLADLDGVNDPMGFKHVRGEDQKPFSYIPKHLIGFAAGYGKIGTEPVYKISLHDQATTEATCEDFLQSCNQLQKQAVAHLIKIILEEDKKRKEKAGKNSGNYIYPISTQNLWGRCVLGLAKSFKVEVEVEE